MEAVFLKILNMSVSASYLVLAVLLVRWLQGRSRSPKWMCVLLWGLVGLRLVLPFSIESTLSWLPTVQTIPADIMMDSTPAIDTGIPAVNQVLNPVISSSFSPAPGASANPLQIWIPLLCAVYLLGVLAMLLYMGISYLRLRLRLRTAVRLQRNLYQSEAVTSPFVLGIFRPKIYLPFQLEADSLQHVVAHEQAHIRRRDHWWKPLGFLLLSIHWFNPLIWIAYILLCRDIELACDEKVIRGLEPQQRADYSEALLRCSADRRSITACPLAFGEVGVKTRIRSVLHYKKPTFWLILLAGLVLLLLLVCFLTDPVTAPESLHWAQTLTPADITRAEFISFPQDPGTPSRELSVNEINKMAALLNESDGVHIREQLVLSGQSDCFLITLQDGSQHRVSNIGNTYLSIDGDYYRADYGWLSSWDGIFSGLDAALPAETFRLADWLLYVEIFEGSAEKSDYLYLDGMPFASVALPGEDPLSVSTGEDSSKVLLSFGSAYQDGLPLKELFLRPGETATVTSRSYGGTTYRFSLAARTSVDLQALEDASRPFESAIYVQSGQAQYEPYQHCLHSQTWDGDSWIAGDSMNFPALLPKIEAELPVLGYAGDLKVICNTAITCSAVDVYDSSFVKIHECADLALLDALPEGTYYAAFLALEQGEYIAAAEAYETASYLCVYKLKK